MSGPFPVGVDTSLSVENSEYDFVAQSETIVNYLDENSGLTVGTAAGDTQFGLADATTDTSISTFLKRPVKIDSYTWLESDGFGALRTIQPWELWASNVAIKSKLDNYAFLRGNLHIKIVVNASPFYYGTTQVSYRPLTDFKSDTILFNVNGRHLIPYSQRPRMVVDPQKQEASSMILPFIYYKNMLNNQLLSSYTNMGDLTYIVYAVLRSANGVTGTGIDVTTYAWMEDIELSGASVGFAAQSEFFAQSDEYGEGVVSKPASAVARAASYFEKIPMIGPFATATRIGATAVAGIASLFGFTNVPVVADTVPQRPEAFPKLASSEIGYPVEKLTLDPKNELSIDPRIAGLPDGADEMLISGLAGRESYLCSIAWNTAQAADQVLFYSRINPMLYDTTTISPLAIYMTPLAYVSNLFRYWRGDIIFKFKIVASKYHKGRLRISYDPLGDATTNLITVDNSTNIVQTTIVDIGETNEVEFRVPYQQAYQFLECRGPYSTDKGWAVNSTAGMTIDERVDNGNITVRVLNALTAPVASSDVNILVYVRGASNIEFADPIDVDTSNRASFFAAQSETYREETCEGSVTLGKDHTAVDNQYRVHFGENIRSLRQLLRRYQYHSTNQFVIPTAVASDYNVLVKHFQKAPTSPGYIVTGWEDANKIIGVGTAKYNFCHFTNLSYLSNAFLCFRGSVNWTFNAVVGDGSNPLAEIRVNRNAENGFASSYTTVTVAATTNSIVSRGALLYRRPGGSGMAMTNCQTNAGVNVQCPMYTNTRFQSTNPANANQGVLIDGSFYDSYTLDAVVTQKAKAYPNVTINNYVGAGTDYSLHFFLNCPTVYYYGSFPTGA